MAWNTRTNLRAVQTTTQLVVAICRQMEDWRRILRHLERLERERDSPALSSAAAADPRRGGMDRGLQERWLGGSGETGVGPATSAG